MDARYFVDLYTSDFVRYKLAVDIIFFSAVYVVLRMVTHKSKWIFLSITLYYFIREYIFRDMSIRNTHDTIHVRSGKGFLSPFRRLNMLWIITITYIIQLTNIANGTYETTKVLTNACILNSTQNVIYTTKARGILPSKYIILSQHVPENYDMLSIMTFVPPGYKMRTINDFTGGGRLNDTVDRILQKHLYYPLYGCSKLTRSNPEIMKQELNSFSNEMKGETSPTVYMIWPSGKGWQYEYQHGAREFKLGAFFMSVFAKIPVCIVHTKMSKDKTTLICQQSKFYYPNLHHDFQDYEVFYSHFKESQSVRKMADEIFKIYCDMDKGMNID